MNHLYFTEKDLAVEEFADHQLYGAKPVPTLETLIYLWTVCAITEEVSPNEKYFVTYSEEDHSIVGWNIDDINEGQLKSDCHIRIPNDNIRQIYISDDKKLAYIEFGHLEIYDMMNNHKIKIDCDIGEYYSYCTFNLKSELILYSGNDDYNLVLVYSTQTKNNEW
ncbi:hypothetical protein RhiirB3_468093, partial [Rhizophagus irregularis]